MLEHSEFPPIVTFLSQFPQQHICGVSILLLYINRVFCSKLLKQSYRYLIRLICSVNYRSQGLGFESSEKYSPSTLKRIMLLNLFEQRYYLFCVRTIYDNQIIPASCVNKMIYFATCTPNDPVPVILTVYVE